MAGFLKPTTIKDAFKTTHKIRSTDGAVVQLVTAFDKAVGLVLAESVKAAKAARRTTVLEEDAAAGIEKHLAKRRLTWDEAAQEVLDQTAADLGKMTKTLEDHMAGGGKKTARAKPLPRGTSR